jgi:phosphate transport system substrate-binding protein
MNKRLLLCVVLSAFIIVDGLKADDESLQIEGSTTVGPIADAFAEYFKNNYSDFDITIKKTGSGDGATALVDNRCDVAMMSRFMKESEFKKAIDNGVFPVAHVIAMDGVCVVVHPSNPVKDLTLEQVRDIYLGKIKNWKELGGPDLEIVPISRDTSSGTFETFHLIIMEKKNMAPDVEYVNSTPQMYSRVKTTVGAIGYVGIGFLDGYVRAVKLNGIMPSRETIVSGAFPVARPLYLFTNGYPELGSMTYKFCTFYLSELGQEIVEAKGYIPVTDY